MSIESNTKIRLVGTQNFAYATGNSYTQGHVHFTTDDHGSIVVNGKVYGTTDASYVYVGSKNIPTYIGDAFASLNANAYEGQGNFIGRVDQQNGKITAYRNTLQNLVTVDSPSSASDPSLEGQFIHSIKIEDDKIIPFWSQFPAISISDTNYTGYYLPDFSANGHAITITNGKQVASYADFKDLKNVVDTFFSGDELDTESVTSYIDTLAEIQAAFKNSYAYTISCMQKIISRSITKIDYNGGYVDNNTYSLWITYRANGDDSANHAYVNLPVATKDRVGLVKYDDTTIKKTEAGYLYVNGELTDTIYSLDAGNNDDSAYIKLKGTDDTSTTVKFVGTGIASVSYNSTNKKIEINVPETVVNYNHHSTAYGVKHEDIVLDSGEATAYNFITSVSLSDDGKLTFSYAYLKHKTIFNDSSTKVGINTAGKLSNGTICVPNLTFNSCGHIIAYKDVYITGIAAEDHTHDEFVWL